MNKELPQIFKCQQKSFNNNSSVFYGRCKENKKINIDDIFNINEIYRTKVNIKYKDRNQEYITNLDISNKGNIPVYIFYEGTKKMKLLNRNVWLNDKEDTIQNLNIAFGSENVKIK